MANSARIHRGGKYLYAFIDPASGTLTQPASLTAAASTVTVTASGGSVTVTRVAFGKKYPFVNLVDNQFKVCFRLSRRIKFGETVTVTIPAGLLSDGTRSNAVVTALSVTNNSAHYSDGEINNLLSSSAKIMYVDPSQIDPILDPTGSVADTAAGSVNTVGWYTLAGDAATIGSDAARPVGAVTAYATFAAASAKLSASDHAVIFIKRGETINGVTDFTAGGRIIDNKGGTSATANLIYAAYGSGTSLAVFDPSLNNAEGSRVMNLGGTTARNLVFGYGLDMQAGTDAVRIATPGAAGDFGNISFIGCKIERIVTSPSTQSDQSRIRSGVSFVQCWIDNNKDASGNQGAADWNDFTFREFSFEECVFRKCGNTDQEHPLYTKAHGDLIVVDNIFDDNSGSGVKYDYSWGLELVGNVFTRCGSPANIESNGDPAASYPQVPPMTDERERDTETNEYPVLAASNGAYSRWATMENNIATDGAEFLCSRYGQASDCVIRNNLQVASTDISSQGVIFRASGGSADGGYTRDSYGLEIIGNTMAFVGTTVTQQYGITLNPPTTDTFNTTNNASKGTHEFVVQDNVIYFGSGVTGADVAAFRVTDDEYADAKALGRVDGTITGNVAYRAGGSQTDFWLDNATSYSTVAAWEAVMDSDASGNLFVDPAFTDAGYEVSDWVTANGYDDLDDFSLTVAEGLVADTFDLPTTIETIANAILPKYVASGDAAGKGVTNWAAPEPTPTTGGERSRDRSRLR